MHLYTAVIASTFGHGSPRPVRRAALRLGGLFTAATCTSFALAQAVGGMPLTPLPYASTLLLPVCMTTQIVVLACLLSAQGVVGRHAHDTFTAWMQSLPLRHRVRQVAWLLPQMLLAALACAMIAWPLCRLFTALGIPLAYCIGGGFAGTLSALGLARSSDMLHPILRIGLLGGVLYAEYIWAGIVTHTASTLSDRYTAQTAFSLMILLSSLSFLHRANTTVRTTTPRVYAAWLPRAWWYVRKIIRSPSIGHSLGLTLCMSFGAVYACRKLHLESADIYGSTAALLGAAFCADMRSLARRTVPCESGGIKGSPSFAGHMTLTGVGCGLLAVSPLVWAGLQSSANLEVLAVTTAGLAAGVCAAAAIAPAARDITGQCTATLLALAIVFGIPQLAPTGLALSSIHAVLACLLVMATAGIEYIRNPYYWRNYAHTIHTARTTHYRNKY